MLFHQIYPECHQIIDRSEKHKTTTEDIRQQLYLLSLDLNMLVHYTLSTSQTYKGEENTQKLTEENLSLFRNKVEIPMKNKMEGKYGEYGVDPILSDYDDVIELLIFEPDKCPLKLD